MALAPSRIGLGADCIGLARPKSSAPHRLDERPVSGWKSIAEFLALKRNPALLLVALVLAGTGEKLWLGFAPKYLETLGAGVAIIGLFDALQTLLGAVYAYPGGWVTDRWGQRRALMLFNGLSLIGYLIVLLWKH